MSITKGLIKTCPQCNEDFKARRISVFCSRSCRNKFYSKSPSKETRQKQRISMRGKNAGEKNAMYGRSGELSPTIGTKRTPDQKRKMRIAAIHRIERPYNCDMPTSISVGIHEKPFLDKMEVLLRRKIHRQHPVAGYFLDGYCEDLNLAIEIDEKYHILQPEKDKQRELDIKNELGCRFLRIPLYKTAI